MSDERADHLRNVQMDQSPREDPEVLWGKKPEPREVAEAAFTLRKGMMIETRKFEPTEPPVITVNGRLRIMFADTATWEAFANEIGVIHMQRRFAIPGDRRTRLRKL